MGGYWQANMCTCVCAWLFHPVRDLNPPLVATRRPPRCPSPWPHCPAPPWTVGAATGVSASWSRHCHRQPEGLTCPLWTRPPAPAKPHSECRKKGGGGGTVTPTPLNQPLPNSPILFPPKLYLVLRDTLCSCEAYGMKLMYKKKKNRKKKPKAQLGR